VQSQNFDKIDEKIETTLTGYARDFYRYFEENTVSGLVADHYQAFLDKGQSDYTSSTNIGFSLLSHISACELGFIDRTEAKKRVICTLETVSTLKLWNGHLYNWYDLKTRTPLPPNFVSSVDSGNFIASLFVLKGYFNDDIGLCERLENIINKTRFDLLYDKERGQFFIGFNEAANKFEGHYDLLASEARILTIVAIALGIPVRAWNSLSRRHTAGVFNTLYSWSGTSFEYLLADLFLEAPLGSLLAQSSKNAVLAQIRTKCSKFWGISECAYYSLDEKNNFRYKAFGISSIAMRAEHEHCVISPYSSFLALKFNESKVFNNLSKIKKFTSPHDIESQSTYGKYGFSDALDFSKQKEGNTVCTFMAHHQGMSLVAILNHLKGNLTSECFYRDARTFATKILLTEPKITTRGEAKPKTKRLEVAPTREIHFGHIDKPLLFPVMNFSGDKYCVAIDDFGQGYAVCNGVFINRFRPRIFRSYGAFLYAVEDDKTFSPSYAPLKQNDKFVVDFFTNRSEFTNLDNGITQEVLTSPLYHGELRRFKINSFKYKDISKQTEDKQVSAKLIESKKNRELTFAFYADLC
ncbi:MAG TPA: glucoamylase family protein, partial [Clostridia bacterium]|nr:glucoamylase family protein [Clostridia bacterium]